LGEYGTQQLSEGTNYSPLGQKLSSNVSYLCENPPIVLLAGQLLKKRNHENLKGKPMSLISWTGGRFRQERDPEMPDYLLCSICDNPVQIETSKTDELGKAVHAECYVLKITQRTEHLFTLFTEKHSGAHEPRDRSLN
jgi:hypothetical protein